MLPGIISGVSPYHSDIGLGFAGGKCDRSFFINIPAVRYNSNEGSEDPEVEMRCRAFIGIF
jgi:hypothetical protein